ncbi:MAG: 50S ribosomal protein L14 [Methanobacteriota archaeon]
MKGLAGRQTRGLPVGGRLDCADNTGAKIIMVLSVLGYHGVHRRVAAAGVGDAIMASVKAGTPEMRRQVVRAVIVRQRRPFRRADGTMVQFEDNAAVIVQDNGDPKGSEIKGPVAREAADRWPGISNMASTVV